MTDQKLDKAEKSGNQTKPSDEQNSIQLDTHLNPFSSTNLPKIKAKKSYSLLSAFVKHTKLKSKKGKKVQADQNNLTYISSSSTFSSRSGEELETSLENYEKNIGDHELKVIKSNNSLNKFDSEHSLNSSVKTKNKFLSKFLLKQVTTEHEKKNSDSLMSVISDGKIVNTSLVRSLEAGDKDKPECFFPISFINFDKPTLSTSLAQGFVSVQTLASRLQQSEQYLIAVFKKYVTDVKLQKHLIDTVCIYSKLHLETERMTNHLFMEMCSKQLEIEKNQQKALQDALTAVIKQNRQLLSEYDVLFLIYEKLLIKFQNLTKVGFNSNSIPGCDEEIQEVISRNEKLLSKLESLCKQVEYFEYEIFNLKKQNDCLEYQLTHMNGKLHDFEVLYQRSKADNELERTTLNQQLKMKEKALVDLTHACKYFQMDLISIEDQLKTIPLAIDWTKLKGPEELTSYIEIGRHCLQKLTQEVITLNDQISIKKKEIQNLLDTNSKLQENLKKSTTELDSMTKKLEDSDKVMIEHKYKLLETELKINEEKNERLKFEYDVEKNSLLRKIQHYEEVQNEHQGMFEQTKMYINTLTSENAVLQKQLDDLNKQLKDTKIKQMEKCSEKPVITQTQYNQVLLENQYLLEKQDLLKKEYEQMLNNHQMQFQQYQNQQIELVRISNDNTALIEKYELEHKSVLLLQNERKKYLEERSLLKVIFEHMKSEISRLQKLEGTVADISKEANKLAIVAEYNKELGKKLKTEIEEKEKTIVKLRTSVEELNDIQLKNTKEKLSLCFELTELNHIKQKLDTELSREFKKNLELGEVKNEIVMFTNSQLEQIELFQKRERTALNDLLKDLKTVTKERNILLSEKENVLKELEKMKKISQDHGKQIKQLLAIKDDNEHRLQDFEKKYQENHLTIGRLQDKLTLELKTYDENVKQLERLIVELRKEKTTLEDSVKYLQNNIHKLHNDLNVSRSNEKELKDALNKCLEEKAILEEMTNNNKLLIDSLNLDKEKFAEELVQLNSFCEKLLSDFEISLKSTVEKEEYWKKELEQEKMLLININLKNEQLTKELLDKNGELSLLKEECNTLKQCKKDYEHIKVHLQNAKEECESLYKQIRINNEQNQTEISKCHQELEELLKKNVDLQEKNEHLSNIKLNVLELTEKLEQERSSFASLSEIHKEVSSKFIDGIKETVEEREARKEVEEKLQQAKEQLERLNHEKSDLQNHMNLLMNGLTDTKNKINTLVQEKETCQKSLADLQKRYNEMLKRCISLESEIRRIQASTVNREELKVLKDENSKLKNECQANETLIFTLRQESAQHQQKLIGLEFQKSEVTLRLAELQRKYETQLNLYEQLQSIQKTVLNTISKLKESGLLDSDECNCLLNLVQNNSASE